MTGRWQWWEVRGGELNLPTPSLHIPPSSMCTIVHVNILPSSMCTFYHVYIPPFVHSTIVHSTMCTFYHLQIPPSTMCTLYPFQFYHLNPIHIYKHSTQFNSIQCTLWNLASSTFYFVYLCISSLCICVLCTFWNLASCTFSSVCLSQPPTITFARHRSVFHCQILVPSHILAPEVTDFSYLVFSAKEVKSRNVTDQTDRIYVKYEDATCSV